MRFPSLINPAGFTRTLADLPGMGTLRNAAPAVVRRVMQMPPVTHAREHLAAVLAGAAHQVRPGNRQPPPAPPSPAKPVQQPSTINRADLGGALRPKAKLVVGVSASALYQTEVSGEDLGAFKQHQLLKAFDVMKPGPAHAFIKRLLALNQLDDSERLVEVVIISRHSPEIALRFVNTLTDANVGLDIGRMRFSGSTGSPLDAARLFDVDLFLTTNKEDAQAGIAQGVPAFYIDPHTPINAMTDGPLVLATDFDGVLGDRKADEVFAAHGLAEYMAHEATLATTPPHDGPAMKLFEALHRLKLHLAQMGKPSDQIQLVLVTARGNPNAFRALLKLYHPSPVLELLKQSKGDLTVFQTLLTQQGLAVQTSDLEPRVVFDDIWFLGQTAANKHLNMLPKGPVLALVSALFFADDSGSHVRSAHEHGVFAVHVLHGGK